jgi:hypothetical protein
VLWAVGPRLSGAFDQRIGRADKHGGGPALFSGEDLSGRLRQVVAQVIERLGWKLGLSRDKLRRFAWLSQAEIDESGVRGVRVHDEFTAELVASGGPDDLVIYAGWDGWLYTDTKTLAALRKLRRTRPDKVRALFRHELAELANARLPQHLRRPHDELPKVPDLTVLRRMLDEHPSRETVFLRFTDGESRLWQAVELGRRPPNAATSVGLVRVPKANGLGTSTVFVAGVSEESAVLATNEHVVRGALDGRVTVELGGHRWAG